MKTIFRLLTISLLLIITILSIPCYIFVLYHFLTFRMLNQTLYNHVTIILLINNCLQTSIAVPMSLSYHFTGIIWPRSLIYCYIYSFMDYYFFLQKHAASAWELGRIFIKSIPREIKFKSPIISRYNTNFMSIKMFVITLY